MSDRYSRRAKGRSKTNKRGIKERVGGLTHTLKAAFVDFFNEERCHVRMQRATRMFEFLLILLLFVTIYLITSIFTPWTGFIGERSKEFLTGKWGLASLIPLFYLSYICIVLLAKRKVSAILAQTGIVFLSFLILELFLGLIYINNPNTFDITFCGTWGYFIASILLQSVGPLGISLFGLMLAITLFFLHGKGDFTEFISALKLPFSRLRRKLKDFYLSLFGKRSRRDKSESIDYGFQSHDAIDFRDHAKEVSERVADIGLPLSSVIGEKADDIVSEISEDGYSAFEVDDAEDGFVLPPDVEPGKFPPPLDILGAAVDNDITADIKPTLERYGAKIIDTLAEFGIEAELADIVQGPTVIQFRIQIAPGIKVSRIAALSNDLALALAVPSLRVEAPILGQPYVGIEIPNPKRRAVHLKEVIESPNFTHSKYELPLPLGLNVDGTPMVVGLESLPHLLVAGTTGSGKSVFISSCLIGMCFERRPDEVKLLLIDPKRVEMTFYEKLPHVLASPIVETKEAVAALAWAINEMERRYDLFAKARVRNIVSYNEKVLPKDRLYNIVIVVDELADLMMTSPKEVEDYICRLAQMARATGIHLILATQRPSVNVVTGLIKANIPARVAFALPSQADSRTILDVGGAEKLLGKGDMLFLSPKYAKPVRIQAPWVDEDTINRFIQYTVNIFGEPEYINISEEGQTSHEVAYLDDPLLEEAVEVVLATGIASASRLQRQLRIGFTRAARIIDTMEQLGIVGPQEGSKPREILLDEGKARQVLAEALGGESSGID